MLVVQDVTKVVVAEDVKNAEDAEDADGDCGAEITKAAWRVENVDKAGEAESEKNEESKVKGEMKEKEIRDSEEEKRQELERFEQERKAQLAQIKAEK